MNIKLSFSPVSQTQADLLVVVLDETRAPRGGRSRDRSARGARRLRISREDLKREYYATLPDGAARAVVVHWSPSLKSWNLWENVKTFTARALRLARDYRYAHVAMLANAADAAPLLGKVVEGAVLGAYTFDRYKQEKDEFLQKEAQLTVVGHPDHQADAEARKGRYAGLREREPGARPHQRAGRGGDAGGHRERAGEIAKEAGWRSRSSTRPASRRAATRACCGWDGQPAPAAHGHPPPRAAQGVGRRPSPVGKGITFDTGGSASSRGSHGR